jgi:ATP-dependent protease HslVU (ClpYQ) peptidase subunit
MGGKSMTCIVGIVHEGRVHIAGDSAGSSDSQITIRRDPKVFRNGNVIFGCTTSYRMIQLLRYTFVPPRYSPGDTLEKYLVTAFINAVRECFKDGGFATKEAEKEIGGDFLVGIQSRLFCIASDYQVEEAIDNYTAVGSGCEVAVGALFATRCLNLSPLQRLELALQAAAHHTPNVRAPFILETLD